MVRRWPAAYLYESIAASSSWTLLVPKWLNLPRKKQTWFGNEEIIRKVFLTRQHETSGKTADKS